MEKEQPARVFIKRDRQTPGGKPATRDIQHPDTPTFQSKDKRPTGSDLRAAAAPLVRPASMGHKSDRQPVLYIRLRELRLLTIDRCRIPPEAATSDGAKATRKSAGRS